MPNELAKKGAQPSRQTRYGCLWNEYFYNGVITQRNPLRGAASHIESEFYGQRTDTLIDGQNCEVSSKLTLIRRPGCSVYNSNTYPAVNRFYKYSLFNSNRTQIKVIADTASAIYDVTGPGSSNILPSPLFTKSAGAGSTYFQGVGNNLFFSDGVDLKKIVGSLTSWAANTQFTQGQYIIDPNGNLQEAVGSQTADITNIQVADAGGSGAPTYAADLFYSSNTPLNVPDGITLTLSGLTTVSSLNGATTPIEAKSSLHDRFTGLFLGGLPPITAFSSETGTATTGTGISGGSQPAWATGLGQITQDGGNQWLNKGSQIENWGIAAPLDPPLVTQIPAPTTYPDWAASTWYSPNFVIVVAGNVYRLTTAGVTGGGAPAFNTTPGATTTDNTAVWTCVGSATWASSTAYAVGDIIQTTFTYFITHGTSSPIPPYYIIVQTPVTVTLTFQCTTAGTSGPHSPSWSNGSGTTVNDGSVIWTNIGSAPGWPGAAQTLSLASKIVVVANGFQYIPQTTAESGTTTPTWNTAVGSYTTDGTNSWLNAGPFSPGNTGAWKYAYSYVNSVTDTVSTAGPESATILPTVGNLAVVQGVGSSDTQCDQIFIWRTVQGGSSLFYLDTISNPGSGNSWVYTDTTPDTGLNNLISAPIDHANDPPPKNLSALTYHLDCVWGAVNNSVFYSAGPYVTSGNGNEAWPPANVFVFPSTVTRLFPTSSGLLVFTVSDIYIIQGLNTAASPLFSTPFLSGIGLVSYDAFATNGTIVYLYTSDNQVLTLDPSSGVSEIGFPIGDQFGPGYGTGTFNPSTARVTWHIAQSQDKGLYVSDFTGTWWRMCPTPSPESGTTWSPKAKIVGGFSSVQSVETVPGTHTLLVGPKTSGNILQRNYQVYSDNGSAYSAWTVLGSLVLAQPGQLASVESLTTDSVAVGTPPSLGVQLDEISSYSGLATCVKNAGGVGYVVGNQVSISGGTGAVYKVTSVSSGAVTGLQLVSPGFGYPLTQTAAATTAITGTGTGLTVNTTSGGLFETLSAYVQDPTQLEPSITTYAQRFYLSQTQQPAHCRHLQILINWGSDTVRNELLSLSLFGAYEQER